MILTIFFFALSWYGESLVFLIPICVMGFQQLVIVWDIVRSLKLQQIPYQQRQRQPRSLQPWQIPTQRRREEEVNLFTDFIKEEEMKI
jgi:hypothetical protein